MKKSKYIIFVLGFIIILSAGLIETQAFSYEKLEEQIDLNSLIEDLPDTAKECLPQNLKNTDDILKETQKTDTNTVIKILLDSLKKILPSSTNRLFRLISLLITISIINCLKNNITASGYSKALNILTKAILSIFIYELFSNIWTETDVFITSINTVITALIPIMTLMYTMGGNVSTAIVNSSGLAFLLTFSNAILHYCLLPLSKICFGLTIAGSIGSLKSISEINKIIKNFFTVTLSCLMTLFSIILLFKTNLSASADSAATRTIKFAGSFIPVVGSALGETVRSLMAGVNLIKSSIGFLGIIIVIAITMPLFLKILSAKICIDISVITASILGCEKESSFLKEVSGIINFLLAIHFTTSLMFVFELIVFVIISPALGAT